MTNTRQIFCVSACLLASFFLFGATADESAAQSFGQQGSGGGFGSGGFGSGGGFGTGGGSGGSNSARGFQTDRNNFEAVGSQQNQGFVGRDGEDTSQFFEAMQSAQESFLEDLGLQPRNNRSQSSRNSRAPQVRITLRVAFDYKPASTPAMQFKSQSRVNRIFTKRIHGARLSIGRVQPNHSQQRPTAILTGQVASADESLLAEKLALLEPGVWRVENRLTVKATP